MVWFLNGGLKTEQKNLFMVKNVSFLEGPPNHVITPFENRTKMCLKSGMSGFQVLGIQMVTV